MSPLDEATVRLQLAYEYLRKEIEDISRLLSTSYVHTRDLESLRAQYSRELAVLSAAVDRIEKHVERHVLKSDFMPVRNVVYGLISVIMLAVISALVALVVRPR